MDPSSGSGFLSRVKRDDCAAIQSAHGECTTKAYADYQAEWAAGDDGRPDWVARKTCNYLTGSIEDCGNKLVELAASQRQRPVLGFNEVPPCQVLPTADGSLTH